MATPEQVQTAVHDLVHRLNAMDDEVRRRHAVDRTVSCRVTDHDQVWSGRLCGDGLLDLTTARTERAQVRLAVASDDLLALAEGRLAVLTAWATGRLRVQAGPFDLLKLRALL